MRRLSKHLDLPGVLQLLGVTVTAQDDEEVHGLCPQQSREGDVPRRSHWSVNLRTGRHHCFSCNYGGTLATLVCEQHGWTLKTRGPDGERLLDLQRGEDWVRERGMDLDSLAELGEWERPAVLEIQPEMGEYRLAAFGSPPGGPLHDRHLTAEACALHSVKWDVMNSAWILPVRDPVTDELWGWQVKGHRGRLFRNHPRGVKKSSTLFGLDALGDERTGVLVESPLDAVRLTGIGWNGISSFGAAVSTKQFRLLEARLDTLYVGMDNPKTDEAGRRSAYELLRELGRRMDVRFLDYDALGAKDVGDAETDGHIVAALEGARHAWRGRRAIGA